MSASRHTNEWVGALVIAAIAVMLVAALQAGLLRDWFKATSELRLILPDTGMAGLEVGAEVEILGTKAGLVRRIVIDPDQTMYAVLEIDEPAKAFIRRDSSAVIRRRFGVAGAAFIDISRGSGEELDWSYAVIEAKTERAPTDSISALIDDTREKVFPILDNVGRVTKSLAEIVERINNGEGTVGYLMSDTILAHEVETSVKSAHQAIDALSQLIEGLQKSSDNIGSLTGYAAGPEGVPAVLRHADEVVVATRRILDDLAAVSQRMPAIMENVEESTSGLPSITESVKQGTANLPTISRNIEGATASLPALLTQLQVTVQKLDQLIAQIRSSWLLGGSQAEPQEPRQFSPSQVLP